MYKTIFIERITDGKKRAEKIEVIANEYSNKGWKLISSLSTPNLGAILIFEVTNI